MGVIWEKVPNIDVQIEKSPKKQLIRVLERCVALNGLKMCSLKFEFFRFFHMGFSDFSIFGNFLAKIEKSPNENFSRSFSRPIRL